MNNIFIRFSSLIFIFLTLLCFLAAPERASGQQSEQEHVVQRGETLFSISREYDIPVGDLRSWNNLESDELQTGQTLRLTPPSGSGDRILHRVQPGESLFAISRRYDVTIAEIQQWNNLEGTALNSGTELIIYRSGSTREESQPPSVSELEQMDEEERTSIVRPNRDGASGSATYVVKSGDTLYQIARDHDMTVNELRSLNNLQDDVLRVGQRIAVRRVQTAPSVAEGAENSTPQGRFATYRVGSGENIQTLLNRFGMSRKELETLNPDMDISRVASGQQLTVLLPPTRNYANPYRKGADLENLGTVAVSRYGESDRAEPTTSGELYNPEELTAAHSNMALGNIIYIENPSNGKGTFVRINDRYSGDGIKLSRKAYDILDFSSIEQPTVTLYLDE